MAQVLIYTRGAETVTMRRVFIRKDWAPGKEQRLPTGAMAARARGVRSSVRSSATAPGSTADSQEASAAGGTTTAVQDAAPPPAAAPTVAEMPYFWPVAFAVACVASLLGSLVWSRLIAPAADP